MLKIIQIISILQGIFLGFALLQRREKYKQPILALFIGCIVSVILFSIGDDDYNIMVDESKWFFFHEPLIITFFFLFIRYSNTERTAFHKLDYLFFIPYVLYVLVESLSNLAYFEDNIVLDFAEQLLEFSFVGMLIYSAYDIASQKKNRWLLGFIIPFTLICIIDSISGLFSSSNEVIFSLDSYGVFLVASFLFYFVTYKLIISPKDILPLVDNKYKASKLSNTQIESIKVDLNRLMTEERLFKNQKLSVNEVASQLGVSRQQLSDMLSMEEMRGELIEEDFIIDTILQRLNAIPEYVEMFEQAFGSPEITQSRLLAAIATFERGIVANNSRFDQYMRGDLSAMTTFEVEGMNAFIQVGCADCHSGPMFSDYKLHTIGVPDNISPPDQGATDNFDFRTPTLRNLNQTAPYMHNGTHTTLEEVMEFYEEVAEGDADERNVNVAAADLDEEMQDLELDDEQIDAIIAFMNTLNDDDFDKTVPASVPSGLAVGGNIN